MKLLSLYLACGSLFLVSGGCTTARTPQFCNWWNRNSRAEARLFDVHDPFPDEYAGPDTVTRPRTFDEPRTDTRQDYDLRLLLSLSPGWRAPALSARQRPAGMVSPVSPAVPVQATWQPMPQPALQLLPADGIVR